MKETLTKHCLPNKSSVRLVCCWSDGVINGDGVIWSGWMSHPCIVVAHDASDTFSFFSKSTHHHCCIINFCLHILCGVRVLYMFVFLGVCLFIIKLLINLKCFHLLALVSVFLQRATYLHVVEFFLKNIISFYILRPHRRRHAIHSSDSTSSSSDDEKFQRRRSKNRSRSINRWELGWYSKVNNASLDSLVH